MFNVIITIDYEIHGNGTGSPYKLMIEPTNRLLQIFKNYGAKLTIMADVAEILKFREYKETYGHDKFHYEEIMNQLKSAVINGHDVQLHIHSGYFDSEFTNKGIKQNWNEYDLTSLKYDFIHKKIKECKEFLEEEIKTVKPQYTCTVFRAANWSMIPTNNIYNALVNNGFTIDTSVFKWGKRNGRVKFDYSEAFNELIPWLVDVNNICKNNPDSKLWEIPIYCEKRFFFSFISFIRIFRIIRAKNHKHEKVPNTDLNLKVSPLRKYLYRLLSIFMKHPWKLDINQANSLQLINALKRIEKKYGAMRADLPIVFIGHSKSFIKYNEYTLIPVLKFLKKNSNVYKFSLFGDISLTNLKFSN